MKQQALQWLAAGAGALIVSAAARALPEPVATSHPAYVWLYRFAHIILANFDKAGAAKGAGNGAANRPQD